MIPTNKRSQANAKTIVLAWDNHQGNLTIYDNLIKS